VPVDPGFKLLVGGQIYRGWTAVEVDRDLDVMCSAFEIEVTERWPRQPQQWPIKTGDNVVVTIDGEVAMTAWCDEVEPTIDAGDHTVKIRGRGKTCDLVDCSAMNKPGRWTRRKLEQIVSDLCAPFGISVSVEGDTGPVFPTFALQQGESVKDAIDRLVQQRGLLPIETAQGNLLLAAPATAKAGGALSIGVNVTVGTAKHDAKNRFSDYVVKGQRQGHDGDNGKAATQVRGEASDSQVTRYRPLMILSEEQSDGLSAASRAKFAATVRAGRAQTGKITVPGSRDASGALWEPNFLVPVSAADLGLLGDLLIKGVRYRSSEDGTLTEIHVTRPEAYSLGEVKGVGLSRLDNRNAGRGAKARKGRKGKGPGVAALADLPPS
jgi:prophage tail gpP-like protein